MTSDVFGPVGAPPARRSRGGRAVLGVLGAAIVLVGGFLLLDPVSAARTLALLVGLALVLGGCLEWAGAWGGGQPWGGLIAGGVLVVGGVLAVLWPGVTLFGAALITGLSLIVHGAVRAGLAVVTRHDAPGWGWLVLAGGVNVVVGVLAIVWPRATVLVLSVVFGVQVLVSGVSLLVAALGYPRSRATAGV